MQDTAVTGQAGTATKLITYLLIGIAHVTVCDFFFIPVLALSGHKLSIPNSVLIIFSDLVIYYDCFETHYRVRGQDPSWHRHLFMNSSGVPVERLHGLEETIAPEVLDAINVWIKKQLLTNHTRTIKRYPARRNRQQGIVRLNRINA